MIARTFAVTVAIAAALAACGDDDTKSGVRGDCAAFGGAGLDCEPVRIQTATEACWRLVECGAIPLENPPDDPGCCLDWQFCVREIERLEDFNRDFVLSCVEHSTCDDLKTDRSPDGTGRGDENLPLCLQHGNL